MPVTLVATPESFRCDWNCMDSLVPGSAFGMMGPGTANYGPAPTGDNCLITANNVPSDGYIDGQEYTITVSSKVRLAQKVVSNEHSSFVQPSAGFVQPSAGNVVNTLPTTTSATYTFTASGTGVPKFRALCGAGSPKNEMWIAEVLTLVRDDSQPARLDLTGDGLGAVSWSLDAENIDITLTFMRSTWVAFGWAMGDAVTMDGGGAGSDIVICHEDPPVIKRYWVTSLSLPIGGVDVAGATCTRDSGSTTLTFQRPLVATGNQNAVTPGSAQTIIYAYGEDDAFPLAYHGYLKGGARLDFAPTPMSTPAPITADLTGERDSASSRAPSISSRRISWWVCSGLTWFVLAEVWLWAPDF